MSTHYNRIAGQNHERLASLSDCIFAFAMTVLVLNLHLPTIGTLHNERDVWHFLISLSPRILPYFMSFLTLGIFWVGQQTQLNYLVRSDRNLTWIHLFFLFAVTFIPFSTDLLAAAITSRIALIIYWFNLLLLGAALLISIQYAFRAGLMQKDTSLKVRKANERRILYYQASYLFGMLLSVINTYWSIAAIILFQIIAATAPRTSKFIRL